MYIATLVLSCLLAATFVFSGARKVAGGAGITQEAVHLRVPPVAYRLIGAAEAAGAAGLLVGLAWSALGVAAAGALTVLLAGAVTAHVRVHDPIGKWAPAAVLAVPAVATLALRIASA